jgi:hypothetical protein
VTAGAPAAVDLLESDASFRGTAVDDTTPPGVGVDRDATGRVALSLLRDGELETDRLGLTDGASEDGPLRLELPPPELVDPPLEPPDDPPEEPPDEPELEPELVAVDRGTA